MERKLCKENYYLLKGLYKVMQDLRQQEEDIEKLASNYIDIEFMQDGVFGLECSFDEMLEHFDFEVEDEFV